MSSSMRSCFDRAVSLNEICDVRLRAEVGGGSFGTESYKALIYLEFKMKPSDETPDYLYLAVFLSPPMECVPYNLAFESAALHSDVASEQDLIAALHFAENPASECVYADIDMIAAGLDYDRKLRRLWPTSSFMKDRSSLPVSLLNSRDRIVGEINENHDFWRKKWEVRPRDVAFPVTGWSFQG